MREIKFRVWDNVEKEFMTGWKTSQLVIRPLSGRVTDGATVPDVKLSQYTGLKDKNGKEIYEGDILKVNWSKDKDIGIVKFFSYGFYVMEMSRHSPIPISDISVSVELVGSIYENPELI